MSQGQESDEVLSDDLSYEGRRKKKRGLAGIGKPTSDSGKPMVNGDQTSERSQDQHSIPDSAISTAHSSSPEKQAIYDNEKAKVNVIPVKPVVVIDQPNKPPANNQTTTNAEDIPIKADGPPPPHPPATDKVTTADVDSVFTNPTLSNLTASTRSEGSPRIASRSKLPNPIHGPSKLAAPSASLSSTAPLSIMAPTKSTEEAFATKKTTPRPLPAHLKQAFTSMTTNSPRTSLNASVTNSLTEELAKSLTTVTTTNQPVCFLRRVSTRDVRTRSYLVGCLGSQLSLGGKPELEYYFPDRLLRVYAGSWNMAASKALSADVENFVLPDYAASDFTSIAPHIFVFGTQETMGDKHRWLLTLQETLGQHFVCLCSSVFGALALAVFIRRELIWYASAPNEATCSPKPYQPIATKGSVAVSFELFGSSFLFVNSHFSAGEGNVEARVVDYRRAITELKLQPSSSKTSSSRQRPMSALSAPAIASSLFSRKLGFGSASPIGSRRPVSADDYPGTPPGVPSGPNADLTTQYDCCVWMGDFNFRVMRQRQQVDEVIKGFNSVAPMPQQQQQQIDPSSSGTESGINSHELLLDHDELSNEMSAGRIFSGFHEGRIRFKPTYKFDVGTNQYDTSQKNRIQSYTDRILFRSRRKNAITCLAYSSVESIVTSDHKPVFGVYDVELRPGLDTVPTGAGAFDRSLYLEGLKNRAQMMMTDKSSAVCSIQ